MVMKKVVALLLAMVATVGAWAQDVIVKTDGSAVLCKVLEVNGTDVVYKKWSDLNGANYVMDRTLISSISYEDGRQDRFGGQTSNAYSPGNQQTGNWEYNDNALLAMDQARNFNSVDQNALQKAKKLRQIGWIIGGVGTGVGVISMLVTSLATDFVDASIVIFGVGTFVTVGSLTTMGVCLYKAHQIKKQAQLLSSAPIIEHEFSFGNGKSLAAGVDVIRDNFSHRMTAGVGLRFNF